MIVQELLEASTPEMADDVAAEILEEPEWFTVEPIKTQERKFANRAIQVTNVQYFGTNRLPPNVILASFHHNVTDYLVSNSLRGGGYHKNLPSGVQFFSSSCSQLILLNTIAIRHSSLCN